MANKKPKYETTWLDAAHYTLLRYPVPGTSGVRSMSSFATIADNAEPTRDMAYLAFNETYRMLIILYVRRDGRLGLTKEYVRGRSEAFRVEEFLVGLRTRTRAMSVEELERLLNDVLDMKKIAEASS